MDTGQVTIRDEISRQARSAKWSGFGFAIAVAIVIAVLRSNLLRLTPRAGPFLVLGLALLFGISIFLKMRVVRRVTCPKCNGPLGVFSSAMTATPRVRKINFCPYCGVNLDEPMPQAPSPAEEVTTPDKLVWK